MKGIRKAILGLLMALAIALSLADLAWAKCPVTCDDIGCGGCVPGNCLICGSFGCNGVTVTCYKPAQ